MLKREQYLKTLYRPYPPLFLTAIWQGMATADYYRGLVDESCPIFDTLEVDGMVYYAKPDLDRAKVIVFREWMDPKLMNRARRIFDAREAALLAVAKKDFPVWLAAYEKYSPAILLPWQAEGPVADKMRKLLAQKCAPAKVDELMNALNLPLRDNLHKQEELDLLKTRNLRQHVKKYEWLKSRYGAIHPYTVAEAREKLREIDAKFFLADYRESKKRIKAAIKEAKHILGKQKHLADFMQYIVYYRTHRTDTLNRSQYLHIPRLKALAKKKKLTYWQLLHCSRDEVVHDGIPPKRELDSRIKRHVSILENGKGRCVSGAEYKKIIAFLDEKTSRASVVNGTIAHSGIARGMVKIVFKTDDFPKVRKGDILVASMTHPHMIPIMKKAAAFVTDEGGITCHAAILSREMKKPCIIGTKIATQVLKDGDRVEVDAYKGIVRKIK